MRSHLLPVLKNSFEVNRSPSEARENLILLSENNSYRTIKIVIFPSRFFQKGVRALPLSEREKRGELSRNLRSRCSVFGSSLQGKSKQILRDSTRIDEPQKYFYFQCSVHIFGGAASRSEKRKQPRLFIKICSPAPRV